MDTDISLKELLDYRDIHLDNILKDIENWDGNIESGIEIIEGNSLKFEELKSIHMKLKDISHPSIYSKDYEDKLKSIIKSHEELLKNLKGKQELLLDGINQLKKKDSIIDSYISKEQESIFIDKDL